MRFILPGMGADHRMYAASSWQTLPEACFLDWPEYQGEQTISAIADRVIAEARIREGDTLIGSSLGGIVGCEIANRLRLRSLVLIGSAQSPAEISSLLVLLHPLAALAPLELIRAAAGKLPGDLCVIVRRGSSAPCAAPSFRGRDSTPLASFRFAFTVATTG